MALGGRHSRESRADCTAIPPQLGGFQGLLILRTILLPSLYSGSCTPATGSCFAIPENYSHSESCFLLPLNAVSFKSEVTLGDSCNLEYLQFNWPMHLFFLCLQNPVLAAIPAWGVLFPAGCTNLGSCLPMQTKGNASQAVSEEKMHHLLVLRYSHQNLFMTHEVKITIILTFTRPENTLHL